MDKHTTPTPAEAVASLLNRQMEIVANALEKDAASLRAAKDPYARQLATEAREIREALRARLARALK